LREVDDLAPDEEGMELTTIEAVQEEAARALADMAREGPKTSTRRGTRHGNRRAG
jgi:hypothetical protein